MKKYIVTIIGFLTIVQGWCATPEQLISAGKSATDDGNFLRAASFYQQALAATPESDVVGRFEIDSLLRNLYMFKMGDFNTAVEYGKRVVGIYKGVKKGLSPDLAEDYNMVVYALAGAGREEECKCYLDTVIQCISLPGVKYKEQIGTLWSVGGTYARLGDWQNAADVYHKTCQLSGNRPLSDDLLKSLNLYGNALCKLENYAKASEVYRQRIDLTAKLYGVESEDFRWANYNLANSLAYEGHIRQGCEVYMQTARKYRENIIEKLRFIPSEKRKEYLGGAIDIIYKMVPFGVAAKSNEDEFTREAYDGLLLTKGLLLASDRSQADVIYKYGTSEDKRKLDDLYHLQQQLKEMEATTDSDNDEILRVYNEIKRLDSEIAAACAEYGDIASFANIKYEDIRRNLGDDEVLIDFTDYKPLSKPRQYVCFEIRKNQKYPKWHYLCNGSEIDSLLNLEKGIWGNLYTGEAAADMQRIMGRPLSRIIGKAKKVYYVPSGIMHKIVPEAIRYDEKQLMGERYDFRRLSSARELVTERIEPDGGEARLYGGLTYGADVRELKASLAEVESISASMKGSMDAQVLMGDKGVKDSLLKIDGESPAILHFSTHGFYYAPEDSDLPPSLQGYDDAMMLTGLVMSGGSIVNRTGLLTAQEISGCNLGNTSIACMASCHSGQGEVTSEGIYGLQRAFKKAGTDTVIMHLWEANDEATRCFMTSFYADLIRGSKDRHNAFRYARDEVRKQYPSPFYWAGFVMID